ncbi:sulfite exporter TauE/SafE family protein [Sandaracinobacter sp. RS1-74]|uniref:sulfite exporter TauE/SafE family protein n=1 Tax=Sandaracinobacteroides sayramensis TaxID=2913411 RepID=UPI001EDC33D3|nr:sulfite exporter TauE/SafE family protein [Sandaracinobacteroides sayramensis]MCG2840146.1 sulfite exporter TauE/SafE family protein [Sandaracinobacteroides sayramensis]
MIVAVLLTLLALLAGFYAVQLVRTARARGEARPKPEGVAIGAVANFFDALGIGSFAPTTAYLRFRKLVPDSFLPAVLNAGHCLPTVAQGLVFIHLIQVDPILLVACIAASVVGAVIGAPIVLRLPVRTVQMLVGMALLIAAALYAMTNLNLMPAGGDAVSLEGGLFVIAVIAHVIMGALMSFGIGLYAPSLIMLSLMGMNPTAAFPIMMGACAFLMPVSSLRFIRSERIDLRLVLGMAIGGIPAVLLAAFVITSLPLTVLRWGVVVVVLYAGVTLLITALKAHRAAKAEAAPKGIPS